MDSYIQLKTGHSLVGRGMNCYHYSAQEAFCFFVTIKSSIISQTSRGIYWILASLLGVNYLFLSNCPVNMELFLQYFYVQTCLEEKAVL